mgnify:CR=1 FL=1
MKFGNGCWLYKEGCEGFSPAEVSDVRIGGDSAVLLMPASHISHRGDTLGGVMLTLRISSPLRDVIRVQVFHHEGALDKGPSFETAENPCDTFSLEESEDEVTVISGRASFSVNKRTGRMVFAYDEEIRCEAGGKDLAYLKTDWRGHAYPKTEDAYMRQQFGIGVGERFYGLGERFTPFVKNGQTVDIWQEDGGTSTEQSYKNIPFCLSNRGYGVFVNHPEKVSFEVGTESVSKIGFSVPGEKLDYFLIGGDDPAGVLERYTALTGRPPLPAPWTFGLWLSTSFTTDYDEETVMSFINGMRERDIPLSVFHFDCFWMKGFNWCDFAWDAEVFPDPAGMLQRIDEKDLKVCVWINPYIAQASSIFEEGAKNGYFLKRPDGSVWQWDMWQPGMAVVDFTNPDARKWYQDKLRMLVRMGVDCFKTDFGERIPTDVVYFDGSDPVKMHNYYTQMYNQAVYEVLEEEKGKDQAILFARSATAGGQKFPVHWGGDCWSDFPSMAESLRGGLSLMLSGFGFWSHDIGGFESQSTADVYKRWCAFGLLSSHSRLHGSTSYRVPWNYDDEATDVLRFFTKLKMRLMPYIYGAAVSAHQYGMPVMRPMMLEFPYDENCQVLDRQYMLGDSLLVAPIFNDEGIASYYLPDGVWTDFFTDEAVKGGRWFRRYVGYDSIPLYVRPGSVIPFGACGDSPVYDYADGVTLKLYEPEDNETVICDIPDASGETALHFSCERSGNILRLFLAGGSDVHILLINRKVKQVRGADVSGSLLTNCQTQITVELEQ